MFTGIIEELGVVEKIDNHNGNLRLWVKASFTDELSVDQSVAHNGVCLTIEDITDTSYQVSAIQETLRKTNIGSLKPADKINLERAMVANDRMDGHIVQGHIDQTAVCTKITEVDGSWEYFFEYDSKRGNITINKGSICVNGVSLTVVDSQTSSFSVAIIPHTFEHTNFHLLKEGDVVNLEFDIIGKYVEKLIKHRPKA